MPVNQLLCEGGPSSPDIRVLSKILAGLCQVRPFGGKYGMGDRVLSRREALGQTVVYGLLDGDFREWKEPAGVPGPWLVENETLHLGWRWERKEIENYLLDPEIIGRSVQNPPAEYEQILKRTARRIAPYQAARAALTLCRPRFSPLQNGFGRPHGKSKHLMPESYDPQDCLNEVMQVVETWNQGRSLAPESVEATFARLLPECADKGGRFAHFLTAFAGKDLLWAMEDELKVAGFASPSVFLERILQGISASTDDVASWLPEWSALRRSVSEQV